MRVILGAIAVGAIGFAAAAEQTKTVNLEDAEGNRIAIATLDLAPDGTYAVEMNDTVFANHFLSMRPFKCLEGPSKNWCHVPYPYDIRRDISADLTDLEYDFLFVWKGAREYGINMWNGVYYRIVQQGDAWHGTLHEMDMDLLSAPPAAGNLRPLRAQDILSSDPESHWLPRLIIE
ncbi:hypothetical protein [Sulfitobacter sp. S190]|uniref:hypothetical protein n=1 Tax=Sulfitobacter sp. S190 TaxID=2867022 RepID=UPI0021A8F484|nr:hypothetical protein [Sulfitobacter sp. S190]UWR21893.1 hypothetical protein K3756_14575 [Sulfitobacter sp. S190]